ncbi:MAG TPA: hypothetical protein VFX41_00250 [Actinomycetales bacterium]|nr:hypothetical protein [Actinomycetales bacterium]
MKAKWSALLVALVALAYFALLGWRGYVLLGSGELAGVLLGVGVLIVPVVCLWAVVRELQFGRRTETMARQLAAEGELFRDDLPRRPSGRVDRAAADQVFGRYRAETEASPQDWRAWYRLACAYDAAGDRKRARAAMRHASALHSAAPAQP